MRTSYLIPAMLALLLVTTVAWFVWQPGQEDAAVVAEAPQAAGATGAASGNAHVPLGSAPFLASHEQGTAFVPDGENLAPSFHVEMEALKTKLDANPQDTTALIRMARLTQDGHKTEEAVTYYRRYLHLHPQGRQAWLDLARAYATLERWNDAFTATQDLLRRYPDDPAGLYNLGAVYANMNRLDEARKTWQRVTTQNRDATMKTMAANALQRLDAIQP